MNKVPVVDIRVSDAAGVSIPAATVRWRALGSSTPPASASSGTAGTIKGQFAVGPRLAWSASTGWRFVMTGPHQFEVSAKGHRPAVMEAYLEPGQTTRLNVRLDALPPELPRQVFTPEVYNQRLLERAAETTLTTKLEVRVVGDPVVMPEVVRTAVSPSSQLPEAIAVATVYEKGRFSDVGLVMFRGDTVNSRLSNTGGAFERMDEREWQTMTATLDRFFADAVDVTRGPERFVPYLPGNMRRMLDLRGEKNRIWLRPEAIGTLSHEQLRRFVSLVFDHAVLMVWSEVSGVPPPSGVNPNQIRRDALAAIAALEASTAAARTALADAGAMTPERIAAAQRYVRRLLGDGYIVRESPSRDGIKLPRGTRMYTVMLGGPLPHVIVEKGKVRVVAVDFF